MSARRKARRRFLLSLGALAVSPAFPQSAYPFGLGVASGYPTASGMVLWTRLPGPATVAWEVAADESMKTIVARGTALADPAWAHSVHVEPEGLQPDRWYWYRFSTAQAQSPIGRTRTAPEPKA